MQSNMFLPFISDRGAWAAPNRISQKNRNLAIAKQLKYRNLLKLHFDVRKVGYQCESDCSEISEYKSDQLSFSASIDF